MILNRIVSKPPFRGFNYCYNHVLDNHITAEYNGKAAVRVYEAAIKRVANKIEIPYGRSGLGVFQYGGSPHAVRALPINPLLRISSAR